MVREPGAQVAVGSANSPAVGRPAYAGVATAKGQAVRASNNNKFILLAKGEVFIFRSPVWVGVKLPSGFVAICGLGLSTFPFNHKNKFPAQSGQQFWKKTEKGPRCGPVFVL